MKSRIVKCKECGEEFDTETGGLYRYQYPQLWTCPDCAGKPDDQLSCQEWQDRHGRPCGGYTGCTYCPSA